MPNPSEEFIRGSGYDRGGFAEHYDRYRPSPPGALLDVLARAAAVQRPRLVVDLGSGTGLSTRAWADRAAEVVGVEPQEPMRARAEVMTEATPNVRYVEAFSDATGLADGSADVVTCSQSFHWMDPEPTLAEAARILRPGGVFAAYDYDVPPFVGPEIDAAFMRYLSSRQAAREQRGIWGAKWPKHEHLLRIEESGRFGFVRELALHGEEAVGADRVVGLALALGPRLEELDGEIEKLREVAERVLAGGAATWLVSYRVRLGVT
ncbi:MAG: class I SAM-dependent methyltransferase [Gaiellaceae bacterium]